MKNLKTFLIIGFILVVIWQIKLMNTKMYRVEVQRPRTDTPIYIYDHSRILAEGD